MIKLKAQTGREWISHAFIIFKKQPFELLLLLLALIFIKLVASLIPYLGKMLPIIISPAIAMGFMFASREVDEGRKFKISILLAAFKAPHRRPLLTLGILYVLAFFIALACSISFDQGALWNHVLGIKSIDVNDFDKAGLSLSILVTMLTFIPMTLILWFTAPLIVWQNMGLMKAIFYSTVAVWRTISAFLIYLMSWISITLVITLIFSVMMMFVPAMAGIIQTFILIPLLMVISVILQCSFYTSYASIFGHPNVERKNVELADDSLL